MKKILYNKSFGGFGFSEELLKRFGINGDQYSPDGYKFCQDPFNRTNEEVLKVVEDIGLERASGSSCKLAVMEVDDDDIYQIKERDGKETLEYVCTARNNLVY